MLTKAEADKYEVTHDRAGNGWAVVAKTTHEYYYVTPAIGPDRCRRVFLAWEKCLKPFVLPKADGPNILKEECIEAIKQLQEKLAKGTHRIIETHVVAV